MKSIGYNRISLFIMNVLIGTFFVYDEYKKKPEIIKKNSTIILECLQYRKTFTFGSIMPKI